MTFAVLLAVLLLAGIFFFTGYYCSVLRPRKGTLDWVRLQNTAPLTFQVKRHPMTRKDTLPVLIITVVYAFTAFFSLGDRKAPASRGAMDFIDGKSYTVMVQGEAAYVSGVWYYPMLGTGSYSLEVSQDGENWTVLSYYNDENGDPCFFWDDARNYSKGCFGLPQKYNRLFKWTELTGWEDVDHHQYVRFIRLTGKGNRDVLQLGKLLLLDPAGKPIPLSLTLPDGSALPDDLAQLFAVDDTVPDAFSWRNSAYFDEIYHPRTALEHIQGAQVFENTHPPLGKIILGLGIRLFGMTPFGWRFMGTLFGVAMIPLLYLFIKNIFGKTKVAVCGTVLLASEFMHLTQTRIATIDTYGVFFVLVSYLFFYRWLTAPATPDRKGRTHEGYGQLALSGVFWGVGCACKWTVIYAGAGLAILYLIHMVQRVRAWDRSEGAPKLWKWLCATLAVSVASYIVIPLIVYTLSYIPYAKPAGMTDFSLGNTLRGFGVNVPILLRNLFDWKKAADPGAFIAHPFDTSSLSGLMLENQWSMLHYHAGVHSAHPWSSRWHQWLVDVKPILYYAESLPGGLSERFAAFNNPVVSWAGLLALGTCAARCVRRTWAKLTLVISTGVGCCFVCWLVGRVENGEFDPALTPQQITQHFSVMFVGLAVYLAVAILLALQTRQRRSGLDVFIAVGFAAQFLPWVFVGRITYAYHYFPSTLFLILALCRVFDDLMEDERANWKLPVYGLTSAAAGLYFLFYPALTGVTMRASYSANVLRFLPTWPL